jgi:hypothetical protein
VEDVVAFITSLDESRALFAGTPEDKVAAAVDAIRKLSRLMPVRTAS